MRKLYSIAIVCIALLFYIEILFFYQKPSFGKESTMTVPAPWKQLYGAENDMISDVTTSKPNLDDTQLIDTQLLRWKLLAKITYTQKQTKDYPEGILYPSIHKEVKGIGGRLVRITGYIVPIEPGVYALSKNVMASCFFCGAAGPETVIGLKFKAGAPRLKTDQYLTIEGLFRYNDTNPDDWIYHIDNAVISRD